MVPIENPIAHAPAEATANPPNDAPSPDASWRDRVRVVLVRARNPGNIGAAARAMHDFGFAHLSHVSDFPIPLEAAQAAIDANAVLACATSTPTLEEAVAGCTLVLGTTAVGTRDLQHPLLPLPEAAARIHAELAHAEARVAILFGSEKTGLSNTELSHCDLVLTIPMAAHEGLRHPSMNLGQAVAVCLWELVRSHPPPSPAHRPTSPRPAAAEEIERLHTLLAEVLEATEYTRRHAASADPAQIRRLLHRLSITQPDIPAWLGILRQILWKLRQPPR